MIDAPKTKAEASVIKYGVWAGNEHGTHYNPARCAYSVLYGYIPRSHQCTRKPGYGPDDLYCSQHARKVK